VGATGIEEEDDDEKEEEEEFVMRNDFASGQTGLEFEILSSQGSLLGNWRGQAVFIQI
jgi:hypothetical protein